MLMVAALQAFLQLGLLNALNRNAGAIQAITTVVLVGVTAWYVFLTRQMVHAARRSQRPYVYIDVAGEGGLGFELAVANYGERAAENVSFEVVREFDDFRGNPISQDTPLARGIQYLPPGRGYRYSMLLPEGVTAGAPGTNVLDVRTRYSYAGSTYEDRLTIDFADLNSVLLKSFRNAGDEIAGYLRRIVAVMEHSDMRERSLRASPTRKDCPRCSELIRVTAKKCPKCLEWLDDDGPFADDEHPSSGKR
jgi:hypothetical protein